jgi:hypothetical protein
MLEEGEVALLGDEGLEAVNAIAHQLDQTHIVLIRSEQTAALQDSTVIDYAQALPLVWVAGGFSDDARTWAQERGPMTLLVESAASLDDDDQRRIDRFVASLGRQSE